LCRFTVDGTTWHLSYSPAQWSIASRLGIVQRIESRSIEAGTFRSCCAPAAPIRRRIRGRASTAMAVVTAPVPPSTGIGNKAPRLSGWRARGVASTLAAPPRVHLRPCWRTRLYRRLQTLRSAPSRWSRRDDYLITPTTKRRGQPCAGGSRLHDTLCQVVGSVTRHDMVNWNGPRHHRETGALSAGQRCGMAPHSYPRENGKFYLYAPAKQQSGATVHRVGVSTVRSPGQDAYRPTSGRRPGFSGSSPGDIIDHDVYHRRYGRAYSIWKTCSRIRSKLNSAWSRIRRHSMHRRTHHPSAGSPRRRPHSSKRGRGINEARGSTLPAYAANGIPETISYSRPQHPVGPSPTAATS